MDEEEVKVSRRVELQMKLEELLGNRHVYYQPPESIKMEYPAIRYSKSRIDKKNAENAVYIKNTRYELIVISKLSDDPVIEKLLELPMCSYDRHYISDNLHHDALSIYY